MGFLKTAFNRFFPSVFHTHKTPDVQIRELQGASGRDPVSRSLSSGMWAQCQWTKHSYFAELHVNPTLQSGKRASNSGYLQVSWGTFWLGAVISKELIAVILRPWQPVRAAIYHESSAPAFLSCVLV